MKTHYETRWRDGVAVRYLVVNCGEHEEPKKSIKLNTYYPLNKIYEFLREGQIVATNGDGYVETKSYFTGKIHKITMDGSDVDVLIERHDGQLSSSCPCGCKGDDVRYWLLSFCTGDERVHGKDSLILLSILDSE